MMDLFPVQDYLDSRRNETDVDADRNNNGRAKSEKYSLRPRSARQKTEKGLELRKEIIATRNKKNSDSGKPKQKPPPLSKYRRKTANARERNRMREINVAFETLRRAVPHISGTLHSGNEKLTKITTLRLAMKYIQALRQVLDDGGCGDENGVGGGGGGGGDGSCVGCVGGRQQTLPEQVSLASFITEDADLDALLSDGESLHFNSDVSESFASPDHPITSPFSELSNGENSPDFGDDQHFSFRDNVMGADFRFEDSLPESGFCEDFLGPHGIGGSS